MEVFLGPYVHSISREKPLAVVPNGIVGVSHGKIVFVDVAENVEVLMETYGFTSDDIHVLGPGEFLMPGLIDTHIHAPQYPNAGLGLDLPLLDWLAKYTFPMEARFADVGFARTAYKKVVQRTLNSGTTTATYFATLHREASETLAEITDLAGQRAFVGKVNMDCYTPESYGECTEDSLKDTEEFIINVQKRKCSRVQPIITPRFALTCSEKLMRGLANLAKKYDVHIQTHLCESEPEIARALELFPEFKNYTQIYNDFGLLTEKTILAHCVHLKDEEIDQLKETSSSIAHCPTSNMCLSSGLCPIRKLLQSGIKIGLGTDVSGGYSSSILEAMRHAFIMSKCVNFTQSDLKPLSYEELFYLATLGGAQALNIDKQVGNFEVGKEFDALHVDLSSVSSPIDLFPGEDLFQLVQKFIMLGDDRNIVQVYVQGKKVKTPVRPIFLV